MTSPGASHLGATEGKLECFRPGHPGLSPGQEPGPGKDPEAQWKKDKVLICRACGQGITSLGDAIEMQGRHQHTFFNPLGVLFEIGCFCAAFGCVNTGTPTTEFSWFKGFNWRHCLCVGCQRHLGWYFQSGEASGFFGLVLNRLAEIGPS